MFSTIKRTSLKGIRDRNRNVNTRPVTGLVFTFAFKSLQVRIIGGNEVTFTAWSNEILIETTEAAVDGEMPLGDSLVLADEDSVFEVPQVDALSSDIEEGQAVRVVHTERYHRLILQQSATMEPFFTLPLVGIKRLLKIATN